MSELPIIWTPADVAMLRYHQSDITGHPYTCGGDRSDAAHVAQAKEHGTDRGVLVPTVRGWVCPVCDYRQFWAHGVVNINQTGSTHAS